MKSWPICPGARRSPRQNAATFSVDEEVVYPVDFEDHPRPGTRQTRLRNRLRPAATNVRLLGPPGSGKTLMARALPSILPAATLRESREITRIYSVAGELGRRRAFDPPTPLPRNRITPSAMAGLVGGGSMPRPGEISLAHRGVLFLDELPEFGTKNLESLRQPLEDKVITISRAAGSLSFPRQFHVRGRHEPLPLRLLRR